MKANKKSPVIIADNQYLIIEGMIRMLEKLDGFSLAGIVSNKKELVQVLKGSDPALLIIDPSFSEDFRISDLEKIAKENQKPAIIILTNLLSKEDLLKVTAAGIKNILYKTAEKDEILTAFEFSLKGKKYYSEKILDMLTEPEEARHLNDKNGKLTPTEIEIVKLVASGMTAKEIAGNKNLSVHTVNTHRKNIFRKLEVTNVSELIMVAIKAGWIDNIEYYI